MHRLEWATGSSLPEGVDKKQVVFDQVRFRYTLYSSRAIPIYEDAVDPFRNGCDFPSL